MEGPRIPCGQGRSRDCHVANEPLARPAEAWYRGWAQLRVFLALRILSSAGVARENTGFVLKKLFIVYLKPRFGWVSVLVFIWQPSTLPSSFLPGM